MNLNKWLMTVFNCILAYGMYLKIDAVFILVYTLMSLIALTYIICLCAFDKAKAPLLEVLSKVSGLQWLVTLTSQGLWLYIAYAASNITFIYFYGVFLLIFYTVVFKTVIERNK
jgi:hypothetical protein